MRGFPRSSYASDLQIADCRLQNADWPTRRWSITGRAVGDKTDAITSVTFHYLSVLVGNWIRDANNPIGPLLIDFVRGSGRCCLEGVPAVVRVEDRDLTGGGFRMQGGPHRHC